MRIGERLKELRGDMSQAEAARKLCVARAQYAKYEKGVNAPGAEMVARFCQTFFCSSDWLLGLSEDRNGKSDARVSALEKEVTRLQGMVAGLKFALDHASAPASCG